ncbi:hypothetical protein BGX24_005397 [Mortierella sp. AD032]|nr:hypothetical protein BGX24_005397 [Mortierella sp. AD032]
MKLSSAIVLSAIVAITCAHSSSSISSTRSHPQEAATKPGRDLYARNRFVRRKFLDNVTGVLPIAHTLDNSNQAQPESTGSSTTTDGELHERSDDDGLDCVGEDEDEDGSHPKLPTNGNNSHPKSPIKGNNGHPKLPTNDNNGNNTPCDCENDHHGAIGNDYHTNNGGDVDIYIGLDTIINVKIGVILKAYLSIVVDALVDIKADILSKIALKLDLDLSVDLDLALKIKAIVDLKVDALITPKLNANIRARVNALVHSRCTSTCGADVDAGILADMTAALKIDLGLILADIDADILADIRVRLDALGLKVKAGVNLALDLDLGALVGVVVGDCNDSKAAILADIKIAVLANL